MANQARSDAPFTLVAQPDDLPRHTHINRGVPHIDSLYAVGFEINAEWVLTAYRRGLFPWYSEGEPVLWHSPNPRMVLDIDEFILSDSLKKKCRQWARQPDLGFRVTINQAFDSVIQACAQTPRAGQEGTWISPQLMQAYGQLHRLNHASSVELWQGDRLVAGLYGVHIGQMFFGESMFTHISDGSKVVLACWIYFLRTQGARWIDCQQVTRHLSSLGARPMRRSRFFTGSARLMRAPDWSSADWIYEKNLLRFFVQPAPTVMPTVF